MHENRGESKGTHEQTRHRKMRWMLLLLALFGWASAWQLGCGDPKPTEKVTENDKSEPISDDHVTTDQPTDASTADRPTAGDTPAPDHPQPNDAKPTERHVSHDAQTPPEPRPGERPTPDQPIMPDQPAPDQPPSTGKLCTISGGNGKAILFTATLLLPDKILNNGQLLVDANGKIACVAQDCSSKAPADAKKVSCPHGVLSPGLINAHDHIGWALGHPAGHGTERYEHRHDWRKGKRGHTKISAGPSNNSKEAAAWAEIRNLMAGATSIFGSGGTDGIIRNLDRNREGLPGNAKYDTFPLGDSGGTLSKTGCASYKIRSPSSLASYTAYIPHVAEGIDLETRNEFVCVSTNQNGGQQLTTAKSSFIHGIGLKAPDIALMAKQGTALVWSPRSNIDLYGNTATIPLFLHYKVPIALGTDWPLSGSMNMLRELQCADYLNKNHFNKLITDQQLVLMATTWAAQATHTDPYIGSLKVGLYADIALFDGTHHKGYRAVIDARAQDVFLVMRQGKPLYGSAALIEGLVNGGSTICDKIDVCQSSKRICLKGELNATHAKDYPSLVSYLKSKNPYPLFFCGPPKDEPSCLPKRPNEYGQSKPNDKDGDGIDDSKDNCPNVFNPIRPLDEQSQADADNDGKGDVCDPCPLTPNTTTCKGFDPNDRDGDGKPNASDNCPNKANPNQTDTDKDGLGDACDPCPQASNPNGQRCPGKKVTIVDIKSKKVAFGTVVVLTKALITARTAKGDRITLQMTKNDPGYTGPEFSGILVYLGDSTVKPLPAFKPGDRVTVQGVVTDYYGQIELAKVDKLTVTPGTETVAPTVVKITDIHQQSSPKAAAYEGVLVEIQNVEVTSANPDAPKDYGEFAVAVATDKANSIRIDDTFDTSSYTGARQCTWNPTPAPGKGNDAECYSPNKCQCPLATCTSKDGRCYPSGGQPATDQRKVGDTFKVIRGVLLYAFKNFKINPRGANDLQR